jgi:hypothetical protein
MDSSISAWVSGVGGAVTTVLAIYGAFKVAPEIKSLRRRGVKELLDLIDEAGNRFEKESSSPLWYPGARPPGGSFEDALAKKLLVSHIFGRPITWSDWIEIREFLNNHDNVRMEDLCKAWSYRDQRHPVYFQMTMRVRLSAYGYLFLVFVTTPLWAFGIMLLINSFGAHSYQLRLLEAVITILSLLVFILNVIFNYGGYAAFLICKKTETPAKQENDSGE